MNYLILYLNAGYLGDKILYEPIIRTFSKSDNLITVEWFIDPISFVDFPSQPLINIVIHNIGVEYNKQLGSFFQTLNYVSIFKLIAFETKDSYTDLTNKDIVSNFEWVNLWKVISNYADKNIFPKLDFDFNKNLKNINDGKKYTFSSKPFVTIHIRSIEKDFQKNLSEQKYFKVAESIIEELNLNVILLGKMNDKHLVANANRIIDFRGKTNSIYELSNIINKSLVHIGGDSGPTHLASALSKNVIAVKVNDHFAKENHGPFNYESKVIRLSKEQSNSKNINAAIKNFIANPISNPHIHQIKINDINLFLENSRKRLVNSEFINNFDNNIRYFATISDSSGDTKAIKMYHKELNRRVKSLYLPLQIRNLNKSIKLLKQLPLLGLSVSSPHKKNILNYVDVIDYDTKKIGASNTIIKKGNKWCAYNTDWIGAIVCLEKRCILENKKVFVFGTGGVSNAICYGLKKSKANIILIGRNLDATMNLAKKNRYYCYNITYPELSLSKKIVNNPLIFINATPLSANNDENVKLFSSLIPKSVKVILDVTFNNLNSVLKYISKQRRIEYISGREMLKRQAFYQIKLFNQTNIIDQ